VEHSQHRSHADCAKILAANPGVLLAATSDQPQDPKADMAIEEPSGHRLPPKGIYPRRGRVDGNTQ
jgi:hypothetical protein